MIQYSFSRPNSDDPTSHFDSVSPQICCYRALEIVNLNPRGTGVVQPSLRYGHLSAINPEFALLKGAADRDCEALWALPMQEFLELGRTAAPALLDDSPVVGNDINVEYLKFR